MNKIKIIIELCMIGNRKSMMYESLRLQRLISNYDIHFLRIASAKIEIAHDHIVEYDKLINQLNELYMKQGIVELKPCYNDSIAKMTCDRYMSWNW